MKHRLRTGFGFLALLSGIFHIAPAILPGQGSSPGNPVDPAVPLVEEPGRVISPKNQPQIADSLAVK